MPAFHCDLALARRLERANALDGEDAARAEATLFPGRVDVAIERVAGGSLIFCGVDSFLSHALGLGLDGRRVSDEALDQLERFYFSRGSRAELDLCPLADASLAGRLVDRGFRPDHFEAVLVRPLRPGEPARAPEPPAGVTLREAGPEHTEAYAHGLAAAFATADERELYELIADVGRSSFHRRAGPRMMAWASGDSAPVAAAALNLHEGVACLSGAWTRADHRRRGIQRALIEARLVLAARAGCTLAQVVSDPGSATQRNAERCGFIPAYTRLVLSKPAP
ncbi:MAG: GNAT family N-acetyltransferase [Myxococcales bacterium]|nr:GNAT family N-acetyltransferase [Myxococcales bacterium]MCB9749397.1 GNAT family N-acetyltransferase [Myxococcales bacterium]